MNQKRIQKKQPPGNMLQLQLLIDADQITRHLKSVASELEKEYVGEELLLVVVAKGAFMLVADLVRYLHLPVCLEMIGYRSDKKGVEEEIASLDCAGKHVLMIDAIFESGEVLADLVSQVQKKGPSSLKSFVLISKNVPRQTLYLPDCILFEIEDRFVVGYGLDYKEYYRGLPDIYALEG